MIVILPTTTGYSVGVVPLRNEKAKKKARSLAEHLARIRKWMRPPDVRRTVAEPSGDCLSRRYAN